MRARVLRRGWEEWYAGRVRRDYADENVLYRETTQSYLLIKYVLNMNFIVNCRLQRLYSRYTRYSILSLSEICVCVCVWTSEAGGRLVGPLAEGRCAPILTSKVRARETHLRPYKVNPQAVLSAVYAWKCKTPTVLHFSKLIFNGRVCELYSPGSGRICYPSIYQI